MGKKITIEVDDNDGSSPALASPSQKYHDKAALKYPKPVYAHNPGPIQRRSCRDILFLLLFLVFWAGMFYLASVAAKYGNPNKIIIPQDSYGNYCGVNNQLTNVSLADMTLKTQLYYLSPYDMANSRSVCLESCPSNATRLASVGNAICDYQLNPQTQQELAALVNSGQCSAIVVQSISILSRCIPINPVPSEILDGALNANFSSNGMSTNLASLLSQSQEISLKVIQDVKKTWPYIVGAVGASMIICFVWIFVMRWFTGILVWSSIIAVNAALAGLSIWLYFFWRQKETEFNAIPEANRTSFDNFTYKGSMAAFIVSTVLFALIFLITLGIRKRVQIAVEILKIASRTISSMPLILLLPFVKWAVFAALLVYFVYVLLCIYTVGSPIVLGTEFKQNLYDPQMNTYLIAYHIFGFLWGWSFIFGISQVTIAGAAATYYFTLDKANLIKFPVLKSFLRTIRYHLGSVAFGSLLIAMVQMVRVVFWYVRKKTFGAQKSIPFLQYILACISYLLACIEKILKFINKNAYIHIAINGTSFCASARSALGLIIRNALRTLALDFVSEFVLFLGKIAVATALFFISWAVFNWQQATLQLNYTFVPAILIAFEALVISFIFLGVYHMTIDTIFLCFLEDSERNDGSAQRPYYMPEALLALISRKKVMPIMQESRVKSSRHYDDD